MIISKHIFPVQLQVLNIVCISAHFSRTTLNKLFKNKKTYLNNNIKNSHVWRITTTEDEGDICMAKNIISKDHYKKRRADYQLKQHGYYAVWVNLESLTDQRLYSVYLNSWSVTGLILK